MNKLILSLLTLPKDRNDPKTSTVKFLYPDLLGITFVFHTDLLQNYRQAFSKRSQAEEELQEQAKTQDTPEMKAKHKECQEAEEQLRAIEGRLGNLCYSLSLVKNL
jgi:hypothetical protein